MNHRVNAAIRISTDSPTSIMVNHQTKSVEISMDMITTEEQFLEFCKSAWSAYVHEIEE